MIDNDEQARIRAVDIGISPLVKAPAGSGKTTLLVLRYLNALLTVEQPEEVLALTFTNKAVNEMRHRIAEALALADRDEASVPPHDRAVRAAAVSVSHRDTAKGWNLRQNAARVRVMTLDSLNSYLAGLAPVVSGFGGSLRIEQRPDLLYREAVLDLLADLDGAGVDDAEFRAALARVMAVGENRADRLIDLGSTMLACRDQWLSTVYEIASGRRGDGVATLVRAIFDQRASSARSQIGSPLEAIAMLGAELQLWGDGLSPGGGPDMRTWKAISAVLLTADAREPALRKKLTKTQGFEAKLPRTVAANECLAAIAATPNAPALLAAIRDLPDADELESAEGLQQALARVLIRLVAHLALVFQRRGGVDFIEVSLRAHAALTGAGGTVPLAERMDYSIRHLLVDEAQDTSQMQYMMLDGLTSGWEPGDGRTLFLVGDPQQSIYGWRQAEVRLFVEMWEQRRLGGVELEPLTLARNFRSRDEIVGWVNELSAEVFPALDDPYQGEVAYSPSVATKGTGGRVELLAFAGDAGEGEAAAIVDRLAQIDSKETVAVLVRGRASLRQLLPAMKAAGVSYACQDIDALTDTDAVRDVLSLAKALWHEGDRVSWAGLLRAPFVGFSWADVLATCKGRTRGTLVASLRAALESGELSEDGALRGRRLMEVLFDVASEPGLVASLSDRVMAAWTRLGGPWVVTSAELEDVNTTVRLLRDHERAGAIEDLGAFELALQKLYATTGGGWVQIMTMHKAKGLEFDHVFMPGLWRAPRRPDRRLLEMHVLPEGPLMAALPNGERDEAAESLYSLVSRLSRTAAAAEELRVLYVGMTRAKKRLTLTLGASEHTGDAGELRMLNSTSPQRLLWSVLEPRVRGEVIRVPRAFASVPEPMPVRGRLLADRVGRCEIEGYVPAENPSVRPSEAVVRENISVGERGGEVHGRVMGILYHELIDKLVKGQRGIELATERGEICRAIAAGMRRRGMPESRVDDAVCTVIAWAEATVKGKNGAWILKQRPIELSERRVAGYREGRWVAAIVDRFWIEDGQGYLVDYKTSPDAADHIDRYRPQLDEYRPILEAVYGCPIDAFVYVPHSDSLIPVN